MQLSVWKEAHGGQAAAGNASLGGVEKETMETMQSTTNNHRENIMARSDRGHLIFSKDFSRLDMVVI